MSNIWGEFRKTRRCTPAGRRSFAGATRYAKIVSVYDGDTITVATRLTRREPFYEYAVRIAGIDTPELRPSRSDPNADMHGEAGYRVRDYVRRMLPVGSAARIAFDKEAKYGRLLGTVWTLRNRMWRSPHPQTDVGQHLVDMRYALPYDGKAKAGFTPEMLGSIIAAL